MASITSKSDETELSKMDVDDLVQPDMQNSDTAIDIESETTAQEGSPTTQTISDVPSEYAQEEPLVILVGPEENRYFVHKALAAAKSPYFKARLKNCWTQSREVIKLSNISNLGFRVALDWMYTGKLPSRMTQYVEEEDDNTAAAFKAADILMMVKLQNELISNDAAMMLRERVDYCTMSLQHNHKLELLHTKFHSFVLKSVVKAMMMENISKWERSVKQVENDPTILAELLNGVRAWTEKPWRDFPGDYSEYLTPEPKD